MGISIVPKRNTLETREVDRRTGLKCSNAATTELLSVPIIHSKSSQKRTADQPCEGFHAGEMQEHTALPANRADAPKEVALTRKT
jgi:hypothetical protein